MKMIFAALTGGALLLTGTPALAQTAAPTLGPHGYGQVRLGLSAQQAKATGKLKLKLAGSGGACSGWDLKAHPTGKDSVGLYVSKKRGVAVIFAAKGMKTPQGIGIGSTLKQIKAAYPKVKTPRDFNPYVSVPGNPKAHYTFGVNKKGKLEELSLALNTQDCVS
ncbi:hypothetical protein AB0I81_52215 [Nonomuraea sp. NPDC050404]|uniref:hypothetical protein n=1 Tax=Nonomuraea sp. NPDC050404 TaxID=3155783 RepID=UPI0034048664